MKTKFLMVGLVAITLFPATFAQKIITADDAVSIALKNSYDILVARNDADIAKVNNTPGNAGMLPTASLGAAGTYSIDNTHASQSTGSSAYSSNALNAGAELNWTVFDGGKMFITKNKLNEIQALGEIDFRNQVLQTVYNVVLAYYNVVKQKQQLASIKKIIEYNQERVMILQTSFNAGASPKNNLLQAKIDLNVYLENAITQQNVILAAKRNLNQVLCRNIDSTRFEVADSIPNNYQPNKSDLIAKIYTNNTSILSLQKQIEISRLSVGEFKSNRLPKVSLNAGYNYQYNGNVTGASNWSKIYGPQVGGNISIPIYQAGNTSRQVAVSRLQLKSAEYNLENVKIQINTQLQNAFTDFENQQNLLSIEQENAALVKENLEISMQRLRLGQTTALEVRQAQQSFEDSFTRLINFKYNLKVAETRLKQLVSGL
jgi:outer membrane protein TolC